MDNVFDGRAIDNLLQFFLKTLSIIHSLIIHYFCLHNFTLDVGKFRNIFS